MKDQNNTQIPESRGNPLGYESIGKLLTRFAIPAIVSMVVNAIYNIVDQIFIGQGVGYLGNAATTVAMPVVTVILACGTCVGIGGSAYAAIKLGERKNEEAERTLGNVFTLLALVGAGIMVLGLVFLDPLLRVFGATDSIMGYCRDYTSIILMGSVFNVLGIGLSNMARTDGSPKISMYTILAGALLNCVLDPLYIFVFHWGVKGAAIATITSQFISAVMLVYYFLRMGNMRFRRAYLRIDPRLSARMCALGFSSAVLHLCNTLFQIIMNNSLVYYGDRSTVGGDTALSAMGIAGKINMLLIATVVGVSIGAQPILGFNRGAGNYARIRRTYVLALAAASAISVAWEAICQLNPLLVLQLFGTSDGNFTTFAIRCLRIFLAAVCFSGLHIVTTGYFQATGQPLKASVLSLLRQLILLIPMLLILPRFWGLDGVLYAGPACDICTALIVFTMMCIELGKLRGRIKGAVPSGIDISPAAGET
ncbi:MAG: MATE family efflux transporter [Lachnospiraceae bacterium]|nr:MATE family efflux transporter [Lachnospiraceae bacterium]